MLIVHKYGGTSVANVDRLNNVAKRIEKFKREGHDIVVVVSAPAGMTNDLLDKITQVSAEPDFREVDAILSTGEQFSSAMLALTLQSIGIDAISLNAFQIGMKTDSKYSKASLFSIDSKRVKEELAKGKVVVITGFQGLDNHNNITTLGRGGSDTTAIAVGVALEAELVEIYTDVDGFYTADPRIITQAKKIGELSYAEALELAAQGAKIMHDRSVALAMKFSMPFHVRSSFNYNEGTIIKEGANATFNEQRTIKGITNLNAVTLAMATNLSVRNDSLGQFFKVISDAGISIDVISQINKGEFCDVSFTLSSNDLANFLELIDTLKEVSNCGDIIFNSGYAKVSTVGLGVQRRGVFATCVDTLVSNNISIKMVSTADIVISCIVPENDIFKAVEVLHNKFIG